MNDAARPTLLEALTGLRRSVSAVGFPLEIDGAATARASADELAAQLDDYLIPRAGAIDAPLLAVVGGSTGAGKSTLVNSILGHPVTAAGVLRPTTRASTLVHHPDDAAWFEGSRVLPGLARVTGDTAGAADPRTVRLVADPSLPIGLAILDAPDIDSVVAANRDLARQLLGAADLWVFVTTAARYADAVPWELLHQAVARGTSVSVVLNRVPSGAMAEVRADLAGMLRSEGLGQSPIFAVGEVPLDDGLLPATEISRIQSWLQSLATDAFARNLVIRRTLDGALDSLDARVAGIATALRAQGAAEATLAGTARSTYAAALDAVADGMKDGTLLRGEVLARWQEFVGTGELLRQLDAGVSRMRDRVGEFFRGQGRAVHAQELGEALQDGVATLVVAHGTSAPAQVVRIWRTEPGGAAIAAAHPGLQRPSEAFGPAAQRLVRDWQGDLLDLVRAQAGNKRMTARFLAFGVNGIAVLLMLVTFSATAGLTGAEVGIAGGSALVAQRLLEAVFGDQAVRDLASRARQDLLAKVETLYADESARFGAVLGPQETTTGAAELAEALQVVHQSR